MVTATCVLVLHRAVGVLVIFLVTRFFLIWDWMMERYGIWMWEALSYIRDVQQRLVLDQMVRNETRFIWLSGLSTMTQTSQSHS